MGSLLNPTDRGATIRRLRSLTPETPRRWGTLDAPRMLCHVSDAMRVAVGDLTAAPADNPLTRTLAKWLIVYTPLQAPPGKVKTAPVMLSSPPHDWAADLAACEALVERVGRGEGRGRHPAFGPLDVGGWGRLAWKHLDHHLRQFGV